MESKPDIAAAYGCSDVYTDILEDYALVAVKLRDSKPQRLMLGALVLDSHQVRNLETLLNYVAETNPAMLTYNAPLCESLSGLANILETLKITKTG